MPFDRVIVVRARAAGFTLLEVLMAMGIFAFAAMGLMLALGSTLDGAKATQREADVRNGLANRLAKLSVGPLRAIKDEDTEGDVKYHSEVSREEVTNSDRTLLRGFWRLRVTADWNSPGGPQTWTVSHLIYRSDG
jgi:prepilin-type N-terminal cleavage/methylation domain-containing protein